MQMLCSAELPGDATVAGRRRPVVVAARVDLAGGISAYQESHQIKIINHNYCELFVLFFLFFLSSGLLGVFFLGQIVR